MRFNSVAARVFVAASALFCVISEAEAQSFFEKLFGFGGSDSARERPSRSLNSRAPNFSRFNQNSSPAWELPRSRSRGRYRTLCVRMCDGFYWPVSSSVSRSKFTRDARICRSRCGEDAKLFYHSARTGKVENMVDLTGRKYANLDMAFRYRKKLVKGCQCRPEPWSYAERARHQGYEAKLASTKQTDQADASVTNEVVAGIYETNVSEEDAAVDEDGTTISSSEQVLDVEVEIEVLDWQLEAEPRVVARDDLPFLAMERRSAARTHRAVRGQRRKNKRQRARRPARKKVDRRRRPQKKATFSFFTPSPGKYRYPGD
jgi:uncharacterized protein DUF2865